VVVAVAQRRLGPSSSATTSTTEQALPSSTCQDRCASRPTTTTGALAQRLGRVLDGVTGTGAHLPELKFGRVLNGSGKRWWT
jgi:hypothetical protein